MTTNLPPFIAICGAPKSGKSEVQRILACDFGVHPVDDGRPLRDVAVSHFGVSETDVTTQEGKLRQVEIAGEWMTVRDLLGRLGNAFEAQFGRHIMPWLAVENLAPQKAYSFGSVRRDQGCFYQDRGGVVVGVRRPGVEPSPYEFDQFDESIVDVWIDNDGTVDELRAKVRDFAQRWSQGDAEAA